MSTKCERCGRAWSFTHFCPRPKKPKQNTYLLMREEILFLLGEKCACCGIKEKQFLTVDHVKNDGKAHREAVGGKGKNVFADILCQLRKGMGRDKFQLLCWNCNMAKQHYGKGIDCPLRGLCHC